MKKQNYVLLGSVFLFLFVLGCKNLSTSPQGEATKTSKIPVATVTAQLTEGAKIPTASSMYKGAFFSINYPAGFLPRPRTPIEGDRINTNEAYFTSPDGLVEFFVFSPQWGGDPNDYLTIKDTEQLVEQKKDDSKQDILVTWATIKARDGSYERSYVSTKTLLGSRSETHKVFGIKYAHTDIYTNYKDDYGAFKDSLEQFAD